MSEIELWETMGNVENQLWTIAARGSNLNKWDVGASIGTLAPRRFT
jgi:hypothetical protein